MHIFGKSALYRQKVHRRTTQIIDGSNKLNNICLVLSLGYVLVAKIASLNRLIIGCLFCSPGGPVCKVDEVPCAQDGTCIPRDKLDDGINHCGDNSDECK